MHNLIVYISQILDYLIFFLYRGEFVLRLFFLSFRHLPFIWSFVLFPFFCLDEK